MTTMSDPSCFEKDSGLSSIGLADVRDRLVVINTASTTIRLFGPTWYQSMESRRFSAYSGIGHHHQFRASQTANKAPEPTPTSVTPPANGRRIKGSIRMCNRRPQEARRPWAWLIFDVSQKEEHAIFSPIE